MTVFTAADELHRLMKQALDGGAAGNLEEAKAQFAGYRLWHQHRGLPKPETAITRRRCWRVSRWPPPGLPGRGGRCGRSQRAAASSAAAGRHPGGGRPAAGWDCPPAQADGPSAACPRRWRRRAAHRRIRHAHGVFGLAWWRGACPRRRSPPARSRNGGARADASSRLRGERGLLSRTGKDADGGAALGRPFGAGTCRGWIG